VQIKKRAAYSLQRGPEGNGHRRLGRGGCRRLARPPARGCLPVGQSTFKSDCLRFGSHETATILVFHNVELRGTCRRKRRSSHLSHQERGGEVRANCGREQFDARGDLRMPTGRYRRLGPVATFRATSQAGGTTPRVASWTWEHVATRRAAG